MRNIKLNVRWKNVQKCQVQALCENKFLNNDSDEDTIHYGSYRGNRILNIRLCVGGVMCRFYSYLSPQARKRAISRGTKVAKQARNKVWRSVKPANNAKTVGELVIQ